MLYPTTPDVRRRRRLVVLGLVVAFFAIAAITYAVLVHRNDTSRAAVVAPNATPPPTATAESRPQPATIAPLRSTSDPQTFARRVAEALFAWDTSTLVTRGDHAEQLLAVGDPTGQSTVGLASDVDNYLPTQDAWTELAQYETRQWLTIDSVTTPAEWAEAESQAGGALLPGTTAYTINGTRHRSGVWEDAPVASEHPVSFTVFIVCGPSYPECHLLRLSILDKPLG